MRSSWLPMKNGPKWAKLQMEMHGTKRGCDMH